MPLDLVIPDLLAVPAQVRMPALERWVARGERATLPAANSIALLARAYGFEGHVPVAGITLAGDGHPDVRPWLRADPVHLELKQDGVVLLDPGGPVLMVLEERPFLVHLADGGQ